MLLFEDKSIDYKVLEVLVFIGILCVLPKYKYYLERIVVLDF